jgi:hypothetical protein
LITRTGKVEQKREESAKGLNFDGVRCWLL